MFKVGDWVQITPTPDLRWSQWYNSRDIYKEYLDKIGSIEFVCDDDERPGEFLYAVKVNFPDGLGNLDSGSYYEWFRADHLIHSSKSLANLRTNMAIAGKQLQEWEVFKKNSTDKMLRHIFAPEPREEKTSTQNKNKVIDKCSDKNMTDKKYDDEYDDNSSNYIFEYTNNTNIDDYYYSDVSDAKIKDDD